MIYYGSLPQLDSESRIVHVEYDPVGNGNGSFVGHSSQPNTLWHCVQS